MKPSDWAGIGYLVVIAGCITVLVIVILAEYGVIG